MKKLRLNKKDLLTFFLCFSFIPAEAIQMVIGSTGYLILVLISSTLVLLTSGINKAVLKGKQFLIWMLLLFWMVICTLINNQPILYPIYYVGKVGLWYLFNDLYIDNGSFRLLEISRKYTGFLIVVTFLQQLIAPEIFGYTESMNARNFFTSDNFLGYYYTAYIAIAFILDYIMYKKTQKKTYVMMAVCFLSLIVAWSVKSIIGFGLIVAYVLVIYQKKLSKVLNAKVLSILFVLIFVGVVFFNVQDNFMDIFSKYFGKDITVSIRYYIWTQALVNIRAQPIFGYGIRKGQRLLLQQTWAGHARSSHNIVLELLLEGGFVGLVIYVGSVIAALSNKKEALKGKNQYEYLFLTFVIFIFFVMELASGSIYFPFYYTPIILINNLEKMIRIKFGGKKYGR